LADLLFDEAGVALCLVAPDGSVIRANAEWLRSTGLTLDEILGEDVIELFPETREMTLGLHARARAPTGRGAFARGAHRRPRYLVGGSISPVPMEGRTGLLIAAREMARSGRAANTLREVQAVLDNLEATFASIAEGVMVYSPDGRCLRINAAAEDIMGVPRARLLAAESVEARVALLRMQTPEEPRSRLRDAGVEGAPRQSSRNVEMMLHKQTGEAIWLSSSGAPIRGPTVRFTAPWSPSRTSPIEAGRTGCATQTSSFRDAGRRKDEFLGMLSHERNRSRRSGTRSTSSATPSQVALRPTELTTSSSGRRNT
jgi:PAS domain S-box-containing protein